ncbi:glycoside hydrolase [Morchella conica CCBAS932]|uniref:Alpha-galactosidase n=1 Tax=Morchella conica CCBAS932 TaxID=1392247 RepID=A0A3N4K860_9PEZI|nr:glycoside hydrolase [Morchella conica CCBAS932]
MKSLAVVFSCAALFEVAIAQASAWAQCGGVSWTGATTCVTGYTCSYLNAYYSQCIPSTSTVVTTSVASTTTTRSSSSSTGVVTSSSTRSTTSTTVSSTTSSSTAVASGGPRKEVGKLPALGWNTWNAYGGDINETKILNAANAFISLGLKDLGYEYVNIDDCWAQMARVDGKMVPDATKFPNGISGLATTIHNLGLKIGIYSDAGLTTCSGFPGSLNYETVDAETFSGWGIDYLKYDNCNVPSEWNDSGNYADWTLSKSYERYKRMTTALNAVSRPIQYAICNWGNAQVWTWGPQVGHSWRMTGDSSETWSYIQSAITNNANYLDYVGFYGHNDMDMMEIGNGDLTIAEIRTHFAAWAFMKSPILLGTDLSALTAAELAVIKNTELLAFHQDATYGAAAKQYKVTSPPEYYSGQSSKGYHVFIINFTSAASTRTITFSEVPGLAAGVSYKVHDMWTGSDLGTFTGSYSASVASHDTLAVLITTA